MISRFSKNVVNEKFYLKIVQCFNELVNDQIFDPNCLQGMKEIVQKNKREEFAVRLIGRIIFCKFLCEKYSKQGQPLLSPNIFSKESIDKCKKNYYHEKLEPLFFELLNTEQKQRKNYFNNQDYKTIPYLNGGLFSPHEYDFYRYNENEHCGQFRFITISNSWFENFFNILDEYNFTVDEDSSCDIELSIDPEMLGRIFENLLNEIHTENGKNAKKDTGSFYTPKEIVNFMVDNSLIKYLKLKTKIREDKLKSLMKYCSEDINNLKDDEKKSIINALYEITILDPACGSAAFPIGILQKMVYILNQLDPNAELWFEKISKNVDSVVKHELQKKFDNGELDYIRKLYIIKNSIFGIDLQSIAVEISKLRCFLTLIIEQKIDDDKPNRGIIPLPNLEFKFIIADSLVKLNKKDKKRQIYLSEDVELANSLKQIRDEYFVTDKDKSKKLKSKFEEIHQKIKKLSITEKVSKHYEQLSDWNPFNNELTNWFDANWMFGVENGFDIVIGNPLYVQLQKMTNEFKQLYKNQCYKSYNSKGDIYMLFYEMGLNNLISNGILCYITSNQWMKKTYGLSLRDNVFQNYQCDSLFNLGIGVFKNTQVNTQISFF